MTAYFDRTREEQEIIRKAYEFEINGIKAILDFEDFEYGSRPNPYFEDIKKMDNWENLWEAISDAVEMALN